MVKNLFKCSKCGYVWSGRPLAERKNVRVDSDNKDSIRCPSCHEWSGHFVSKDVPSSLVHQKSLMAHESVEARIEKTEPEKSLDDYLRLLKKSKDAESLKAGLMAMATGGGKGLSGDDLIKILTINRLGSTDDSKTAIAELRNDFKELKRALEKPATAPAPTSPEIPPYLSKLVEKVIESYGAPRSESGLRFNTLADLKNATQFFTSSGGKNLIDVEFEKIRCEGEARKLESNSKLEGMKILANGFKGGLKDMGWNVGAALSSSEGHRSPPSENPGKPIKVVGTPTENPDLLKIPCPECGAPITYEIGVSKITCPKCDHFFMLLPEIEHEKKSSRSPGSESPRSPGVEIEKPHSQDSFSAVTGKSVSGRGAKRIVESGDSKPRRKFFDSVARSGGG